MTHGIHHVTAVAGDPQSNVDFYTDVLGLRLVKQTVNFDDPTTYHLYYGDETGTPGTILTFFPFNYGRDGTPGAGQATATAFTIPDTEASLEYWTDRLRTHGLLVEGPTTRFDETVIRFEDEDGQPLEFVTGDSSVEPWTGGPVPTAHAIRGFHSVTLDSIQPDQTGDVLELLGYEQTGVDDGRVRYETQGETATVVDVLTQAGDNAILGSGTVHHVAFRAPDDETQAAWSDSLADLGIFVTEQKDRQYFRSTYFREPGGVLFEIATDEPGFATDEDVEALGSTLQLPPWLEDDRDSVTAQLEPLDLEQSLEGKA